MIVTLLLLPGAAWGSADDEASKEAVFSRIDTIEAYEDPRDDGAHLEWAWLERAIDPWYRLKRHLHDDRGLDFFFAYSPQVQIGSQEDDANFIGDRWDLMGDWQIFHSERFGTGSLQLWLARKMALGNQRGAEFQSGAGSIWELNDLDTGRSNDRNEIEFLWWEQQLFDRSLRLVLGKLDPSTLMNDNRFLWDDRLLFSFGTLSADPVVTLNESLGLGAFAQVRFGDAYVSGLWLDADAKIRSVDFSSVDNGRYAWGAEIGFGREMPGLGDGNYRASFFLAESIGRGAANKSSLGGAISIDQDLGENFAVFAYWARRAGRLGSLEQNLSAGVVMREPFGFPHDFVGLGLSWGEPDGSDGRDAQLGLEAFWRLRLVGRIELTPLVQYIILPGDSNTDGRVVGGLRLRFYL
jgi:hypothetical protein